MRFNNRAWAAGVTQNKCPQCARFRRRAAWPPSATPHASAQGALALDHGRCLAHTKTNAHGKKARLASRRGLRSGHCSRSRTPEEHSVAAATTKTTVASAAAATTTTAVAASRARSPPRSLVLHPPLSLSLSLRLTRFLVTSFGPLQDYGLRMLGCTEEVGGPLVRVAVPRAVAMVVEEAGRASPCVRMARNDISPTLPRRQRRRVRGVSTLYTSRFVRVLLAQGPC